MQQRSEILKSTKYQLMKADFDALSRDIRLYRKRIEELEKENKQLKHLLIGADIPFKYNDYDTRM